MTADVTSDASHSHCFRDCHLTNNVVKIVKSQIESVGALLQAA